MHPRCGCIIPQAVTHSLVLLKMGKISAQNMLSWLELLISHYCFIQLVVYIIYYLYQWCTVKQISDNEIYLFIKYIKSVLWRVAKHLSYIEDTWCLKVKPKWLTVSVCKHITHYSCCCCHPCCIISFFFYGGEIYNLKRPRDSLLNLPNTFQVSLNHNVVLMMLQYFTL